MVRKKALKSTWFNRLVQVPLILILWITVYPFYAIGVIISGFCIVFWTEVIKEVFFGIIDAWREYTNTIKDACRFISGRIKNK